jgi:hypothetical protein
MISTRHAPKAWTILRQIVRWLEIRSTERPVKDRRMHFCRNRFRLRIISSPYFQLPWAEREGQAFPPSTTIEEIFMLRTGFRQAPGITRPRKPDGHVHDTFAIYAIASWRPQM